MLSRKPLEPVLLAAALTLLRCGSDDLAPPPPSSASGVAPTWSCVDEDGDSYGTGCRMGIDCDDSDAEIGNECLCEQQQGPGCGCSEAGAQAPCGTVYSKVGDTVICGQGVTSCDGQAWGECIINNAVTLELPKSSASGPGLRTAALATTPTACAANPCDPACKTFVDVADGNVTLASSTGVMTSPSGVTLLPGEAVIVPGVDSTGYACNDAPYPAGGGCAHHPCRVGAALGENCDGTKVPVTHFSDGFSSGNAQGWTLGGDWAIDDADSSSGHTTGNGDPSTDTTATSDNRVAGTVIGGNIGVPLSEGFSSLSAWSESNWGTASRSSSSGYTVMSGNPVARSETNCGWWGCSTSTLSSGSVNLTAYASASLTFQYYLSSSLGADDYLRVNVSSNGGASYSTVLTKSGADRDSTWHSATINLAASYLVSNFRVQFVARDTTSGVVEIDDVKLNVPAASSYLVSPSFSTAASTGPVTLSFKRWLNLPSSLVGTVEVYDGSTWHALYTSNAAVSDNAWRAETHDITGYKSASNRLRFGYSGTTTERVSGWNLDDVAVTGSTTTAGTSLCVSKVCAARPQCCTTSWTYECVQLLSSACQVECAVDTAHGNACTACFNDPTMTVDVDGDGQSPATGDCRECDPGISAGAYDLPGNNIDENCDGTADNEVATCDSGLSASGDPTAHAKAMGICKAASGNSWGLVSAEFVQADGVTSCSDSLQRRIMTSFGSGNTPTAGSAMSVFSSGTARVPGTSGYIQPNGEGYHAGTWSAPKYSVPSASGCSSGTAGRNSCGLKLVIRAPTNANSFRFNFNFFTSEYPEWLCTAYNDAFVAYYEGSLNTATNKNISFDSAGNPVSVNNGLFTIPGWPPPASGSNPYLNDTGFDGVCANNYSGSKYSSSSICGGSTGWLLTTAPVKPKEDITLIFNVWDTGDEKWDSTVLLDNFVWSTQTATVATGHYVPSTDPVAEPAKYAEGWFVRDYDMSTGCADDMVPVWSLWSWSATTPGDSQVEFYVQSASTAAGLDGAPKDALVFTDPPGPSALAKTPAIARAGSPDTRTGAASVQDALARSSRPLNDPYLRISAKLKPTTDLLQAPVLTSWNLQTSCKTAQ